jgi:hypothetical protein
VMVAVDDVLVRDGMPLPHRVDVEERHRGLRVGISCRRRVPQYVRQQFRRRLSIGCRPSACPRTASS